MKFYYEIKQYLEIEYIEYIELTKSDSILRYNNAWNTIYEYVTEMSKGYVRNSTRMIIINNDTNIITIPRDYSENIYYKSEKVGNYIQLLNGMNLKDL
jgi:hypothetical protein